MELLHIIKGTVFYHFHEGEDEILALFVLECMYGGLLALDRGMTLDLAKDSMNGLGGPREGHAFNFARVGEGLSNPALVEQRKVP